MSPIPIRSIHAAQTHVLRGAVLRPGGARDDLIYEGDDAPDTIHFGAFDGENIIGIASIYRENWPFDAGLRAWRLRGMAVDAMFRRRGVGAVLIGACLSQIQAQGGDFLWCNARVVALGFYRGLGFESVGEEFEIAGVGPHFRMSRGV